MHSAMPDILSVRPGPTIHGQRPMLLDRQMLDLDPALFLETFGQTDPATEPGLQPLVKEVGAELEAPPISLGVPWPVQPQPGLVAVAMDAPTMQVPPKLPAPATVLQDELPPKADDLPQGPWPTQTVARRPMYHGIPLPLDAQATPDGTRVATEGAAISSPDQHATPSPAMALTDGTAKEGASNEVPKTVAATAPIGMPEPAEAKQASVIAPQPIQAPTDPSNPIARLDMVNTWVNTGQIALPVMQTVAGHLRIQTASSQTPTPHMRMIFTDQMDSRTAAPARPHHPSVQEHSLRLTAVPSLGIDPAVGMVLATPTLSKLAETPFANALPVAAIPTSLALPPPSTPKEPAATIEPVPVLPAPVAAAEVISKITPVTADEAAPPGDPAVTLQPAPPATLPSTGSPGTTMPNAPQSPVQQVTVALVRLAADAPGRIELTLTPETLGRVHFDMRPEGAGLAITVSAEEPETLDLIRRHLPELMAELRQAGVQAGTLSFGDWAEGQHPPAKDGPAWTEDKGPEPTPPASLIQKHRPTAPVAGLDLRL
jgi:flagellar hook-length control protein FliK